MSNYIADTVDAWIQNHWKEPYPCPLCHSHDKWQFQDTAYALVKVDDDAHLDVHKCMPVAAVTCDTCGYSFFISATKAGAI